MTYYVYILANVTNTTIYVGVTKDLIRRIYEHKHNLDPDSFTARYGVHKLVYFEETSDINAAISREKQLKSWNRKRKNTLVSTKNPAWQDLYDDLLRQGNTDCEPACGLVRNDMLVLAVCVDLYTTQWRKP